MLKIVHKFSTHDHWDIFGWICDLVLDSGGDGDCHIICKNPKYWADKFEEWAKSDKHFCRFKRHDFTEHYLKVNGNRFNGKAIVFIYDQESVSFSTEEDNLSYNQVWLE